MTLFHCSIPELAKVRDCVKDWKAKVGFPIAIFLRRGAELSDKIVEVIIKNTSFQYEHSFAARSVAKRSDIYRVDQERFKLQIAAITLAEMNDKMASEIGLCHELWKYRSKKSLPQIAHLRYRKSHCIAIGILTYQ
jgi:hypothetical protein